MSYIIEILAHGIYVPIILFSGISCWMFISKMIIPAFKAGRLDIEHYAIGISAVLSLAAHFGENSMYGPARWFDSFSVVNEAYALVMTWKVLILASSIFAVVALNKAKTGAANLRKVTLAALVVWALGAAAATRFV